MTLTEAGKIDVDEERDRTVKLNFPDSMRALRTGLPREPAAY
jgi:hypothetical protein